LKIPIRSTPSPGQCQFWDGSASEAVANDASVGITDEDLARFPGWGAEVIQKYMDNGWTIEQLAQYYQEQVQDNQ